MKSMIAATLLLASVSSFAQTMMGNEAKEMFSLMSHAQVSECMRDLGGKLINVTIKKDVFRCPGCNTYTITGNRLNIDVPTTEKTVITLKGRGVRSTFGFAQTYECTIEN